MPKSYRAAAAPGDIAVLLRVAAARIETPDRWLHDNVDEAVDAAGQGVPPDSPVAARWDIYGALTATSRDPALVDGALEYLEEVLELDGTLSVFSVVMKWHDMPERTHAEVLGAFGRAREQAERDANVLADRLGVSPPFNPLAVQPPQGLPDVP